MLLGSARMVLETGKHPGELKDAVCSPGGSTIQGVRLLEERAFRGAVTDAVLAAFEKTKDLGRSDPFRECRGEHCSPADLTEKVLFQENTPRGRRLTGEQCSPLQSGCQTGIEREILCVSSLK